MSTQKLRVQDVMQSEVVTLQRCDRLDLAEDVMRLGSIRHMPVLASGRVVGVVSNRDLLAAGLSRALDFEADQRRTFLRSVEVSEMMSKRVVTIGPGALLVEAAERMVMERIGCLPVVKPDGAFVGIVTETDLIRAAWIQDADAVVEEAGEGVLSELGGRIEQEVDALRAARDELRVQMHLGRADARDRFEELEERWHDLERRLGQVADEARRPMREVGDAVRGIVAEIQEGYRKIRDSL